MYCTKKLKEDLFWVGASDRRLALFENAFPIPRGVSYNSYLVKDEKNILIDTADKAVSDVFFENIEHVLQGEKLDYVIINHMEPDHCATLGELILRYPQVRIIGNSKTLTMIKQFFNFDVEGMFKEVKENDIFSSGKHSFTFVMAPMVHWPEVMVTYDLTNKTLFSADAFGTFGAINGNIFADKTEFEKDWLDDARRYYTNIVGKYGVQVSALLKKAQSLEIEMICPLHGPVWRENIPWFVEKHQRWASNIPEVNGVVIAYASIYGNTENACEILASELDEAGIKNIAMYDVSATHSSQILSDCFKFSHIVFAASTYNGGIFINMENLLNDIKAHNLQNRTVAFIENGTWAATSGRKMKEIISSLKNMTVLEDTISIKSSVKAEQLEQIKTLAEKIAASVK